MYQRIFFCFIVFIGMAANAHSSAVDTINVRGKVTSGGQAIVGAVVTLLGQGIRDTTDDNGEYSITKNIVAVLPSVMPRAENVGIP
ncbi:MAG: hypothetical protein JXA18_11410 [Chitinispirillaceae bacterium]|nr:hypothetical protein [Chitinispirillaceae bacterium]